VSWGRTFSFRAAALLTASVVLALSGVVVLVFQPHTVSAGVTPGVAPDFAVGPGDTAPKNFSKTLIGSAELKGNPDDCRTDPLTGLTCAAHRLKLDRVSDPTYQLTIVLEWDAQPAGAPAQVPDIDMYLFDQPDSSLDSTLVGGAGTTSPEQIKIPPKSSEYDIVVQAYAGAITGYKITVSYTNTAAITAGGITPDIVLRPHGPVFNQEYQSVIAAGAPAVLWLPDGCRNDPSVDFLCDVYRIKVNRNLSKEALNFVVVTLDWEPVVIPGLVIAVAGLNARPVPDLNIYVYDAPDHALEGVGGAGLVTVPERLGFVATQDEYDLVVQSAGGTGINYKLSAFMSDEIFEKPYEFTDPETGEKFRQEPDGSIVPVEPDNASISLPQLGLAPIGADDQIAGIGLGTTEQFDSDEALRLGRNALRNATATTKPPSGVVLFLALVALPLGLFAAGVLIMRRRHNIAF
jgi:hypothetical protein